MDEVAIDSIPHPLHPLTAQGWRKLDDLGQSGAHRTRGRHRPERATGDSAGTLFSYDKPRELRPLAGRHPRIIAWMRLLGTATLALLYAGFLDPTAARAASTPVVIVTPQDGDVVPLRFNVEVTYGDVFYGDTDDTGDAPADIVELWVDGELLDQCSPCTSPNEAIFEVELTPGEHELEASAHYLSAAEFSDPITITVAQEKDTGGCACNTSNRRADGLLWFGVLSLCLRRRRAGSHSSLLFSRQPSTPK